MKSFQESIVRFSLKYWYVLVVLVCIGSILAHRASAQTMSNDNYILQLQELDVAKPKPTVASDGTSNVPVAFDSDATTIKNNILGVKTEQPVKEQSDPFIFSISETLIDFSTLSPTNPIKRSHKLTISSGSANGYSIIAFEDKELSASAKSDLASASSAFIPDTTCDNGLCSETVSALWTNPLTYGFGYRCDNVVGTDCEIGFSEVGFYKQFANNSLSEVPQKVTMATSTGKEKTVQITYKVNIPSTQQFAFYSNTVTFIGIPNF